MPSFVSKTWPSTFRNVLLCVQQQQGSMSHSFLLDDDSSNPFNANDMQQVMDDKPLYTEMTPPEPLRNNPAFEFLYRDLKLPTNSPPAQ
jgi:hypothetical protein